MLPRNLRLTTTEQFRAVYRNGIRVQNDCFSAHILKNGLRHSRFSPVVRKAFGSAVNRNRAKRRARRIFQLVHPSIDPSCDIVLFPRAGFLTEKQGGLLTCFETALKRSGVFRDLP